MPSPDACRAWHPSQPAMCGRVPGHQGGHAGNCSCGFLLFWDQGTEAAPSDQLAYLSTNLSMVIDWLRQDCTARNAGQMADVVYEAWLIVNGMTDHPQYSPAGQPGINGPAAAPDNERQ